MLIKKIIFLIIIILSVRFLFHQNLVAQPAGQDPLDKDLVLINKIEAIVIGPAGNDIIDTFDVQRPSIDGRMRSIDDQIMDRKMYQEAKDMKMIDEEAVKKQLKMVQKDNNLSDDQMKQIFQAGGYSWDEGVAQFEMMTAVNQVTGFKIGSRMIIGRKEIEAYYHANPVKIEPEYQIQMAEVGSDQASSMADLKKQISSQAIMLKWTDPFWIKKSELAQEKQYICKLKPGRMHVAETAIGFEVIKLVDTKEERLLSLEERYQEIEHALQPVKYAELFNSYKAELDEKMAVIRF